MYTGQLEPSDLIQLIKSKSIRWSASQSNGSDSMFYQGRPRSICPGRIVHPNKPLIPRSNPSSHAHARRIFPTNSAGYAGEYAAIRSRPWMTPPHAVGTGSPSRRWMEGAAGSGRANDDLPPLRPSSSSCFSRTGVSPPPRHLP